MRQLSQWSADERRRITGVFTDIDDTLTTEGAITADALQALADLKAAGLNVIAITGRHVGWCESLMSGTSAAPWAVDAMVAENGAVALVPCAVEQNARRRPSRLYQQDAATRSAHAARMAQVAQQILAAVPGAQRSRDEGGRETDLAFDYNEFAKLPPDTVAKIIALLQAAGMRTTVSSIHIHGCYGDFNKWTGARWIVRELWQRDLRKELDHWVFVGDSGNDQPMFEHFTHSVGVANIRRFEADLSYRPRYITKGERGAGFAEVVRALLDARSR
jgi:HAD superfamily hydrolase (TIGR01484 family)